MGEAVQGETGAVLEPLATVSTAVGLPSSVHMTMSAEV